MSTDQSSQMMTAGAKAGYARVVEKFTALMESDAQVRDSLPIEEVSRVTSDTDLSMGDILETIMNRYADRPALGTRGREAWTDPVTGRTEHRLLRAYQTMTYRELWQSAGSVATEWVNDSDDPCAVGDFIAILSFSGADYMFVDLAAMYMGGVVVPLPMSAPAPQQAAILDDTKPLILAAGVDFLATAVDAVLLGWKPRRVIVFDHDERVDAHREAVADAQQRLAAVSVRLDLLDDVLTRGRELAPAPVFRAAPGENPLRSLTYTSGSTGSPKGVMFTERSMRIYLVPHGPLPMISLSYLPMSHSYGRGTALVALAHGGSVHFTAASDMSTLLEDLAMVRPTLLTLVPRVGDLLRAKYFHEVGADPDPEIERAAQEWLRQNVVGNRVLTAMCGGAPMSKDTEEFLRVVLDCYLFTGYGGTEMGAVLMDGVVQRPPVVDYKLVDVPELGYFTTDQPHPRGELVLKTESIMEGYYNQPELTSRMLTEDGYYKTNDIMAEIAPDRLVYLDRRNNVLKLAQGEFVAVSKLEASFSTASSIDQIYLHGNSRRSYLLGVVVPSPAMRDELASGKNVDDVKAVIRSDIQQIAAAEQLNSYEIPRDFLLEMEPFTQRNGLQGGAGKHQRPALEARYGDRIDALYESLEADRLTQLGRLRAEGAAADASETLARAVQATLGVAASDVKHDSRFIDIGGDSLAALSLSNLLQDIYDVEVPVGAILDPAATLDHLSDRIAREITRQASRATFLSVHDDATAQINAGDLTLAKFIDDATLSGIGSLRQRNRTSESVLLTGATGFLGRRMAMDLLRRAAATDGRVVCIARGTDADHARQRIEDGLDTDSALVNEFRSMSAYLDVIAGDLGDPGLGLETAQWNELAESVDRIVHVGALVNHVLPYRQLFGPNVAGTAELVRLAFANKLKPVDYVSTIGVLMLADHVFDEATDVRAEIPRVTLGDGYGIGYSASKWAGEVLLREAADLGLPVTVFRSGMILADRHYSGQLNVPDIFTRLLFTVLATGIAPATFYAADTSGGRPRATYSGLAVDVLSAALTAMLTSTEGTRTYNVDAGHSSGVSLDTMVDWMVDSGRSITRIDEYAEWVARCETAMSALPVAQRRHSLREVMGAYRYPASATDGPSAPSGDFRAAARAAGAHLPPVTRELIDKYVRDIEELGLLG